MARYVRSVEIQLGLRQVVMYLLHAMSVHFQFVGLVMSMSAKMEINPVLSARLDIKDTKVSFDIHAHILFALRHTMTESRTPVGLKKTWQKEDWISKFLLSGSLSNKKQIEKVTAHGRTLSASFLLFAFLFV